MTDLGESDRLELATLLLRGDHRALARAITLVEEDDPRGWELVREIYPRTGRAAVLGFTGPPGVGKSTLIAALTAAERSRGRTVSMLSIDPSSPFTKGAVLGDRVRLGQHFLDAGVFIRSMASRGALGGLNAAAWPATLLLDAAGADVVLIETVGVGQGEIEIVNHADTVTLVLMPGSGDSIQALKAGVMEIPDVIVVNKADHPLAATFVREVKATLALGPNRGWSVPVIETEATTGAGVEELLKKLVEHRQYLISEGVLQARRQARLKEQVLALATARIRRQLEARLGRDASAQRLLERVMARELDPITAAAELASSDALLEGS